jgi:phosphoglycolate phosphatase-like HAD superfamily hydrolase
MYAVGAAWGYYATEKLFKAGADFMADTPLDVLSFLYRYVVSGNEK